MFYVGYVCRFLTETFSMFLVVFQERGLSQGLKVLVCYNRNLVVIEVDEISQEYVVW